MHLFVYLADAKCGIPADPASGFEVSVNSTDVGSIAVYTPIDGAGLPEIHTCEVNGRWKMTTGKYFGIVLVLHNAKTISTSCYHFNTCVIDSEVSLRVMASHYLHDVLLHTRSAISTVRETK
jgi:hypothetical protein